jgi:hypothetical protein
LSLPINTLLNFPGATTRKPAKINGVAKMSKFENTKNGQNEVPVQEVNEDEFEDCAEVIRIIENLIQLHKINSVLLKHLRRKAGQLQASSLVPDLDTQTINEG